MKKAMRKMGAVLCAGVLCFGMLTLAGCGGGQQASNANNENVVKEIEADETATQTFTDSLGREVELPLEITKICPSGFTSQQVLLTMAPEMMVGLAMDLNDDQLAIFGDKFKDYPVFGAVLGAKDDLNREAVAAAAPQVIIDTGEAKKDTAESLDALQEQLGIPCVFIEMKLEDFGAGYKNLGKLLGKENRGEELAAYCTEAYNKVKDTMAGIPEGSRAKLAYLLGENGLNAYAKTSFQAQVVDMVCDNVVVIEDVSGKGTGNEISLEQIALWNPETIIFQKGSIYETVGDDPAWAHIAAIADDNYYQVPDNPWCWMGNPPTVNMIMGMQWLPRLLYPDAFDDTIEDVTRDYYAMMYSYDLTDAELAEITEGALPHKA